MANRIRNERLEIKLTEEEKALFEEKKRLAKCRNMSHFIRKCVLEKEIYQVDLEPFRDLQGLLSNATNNINQIAKAINTDLASSRPLDAARLLHLLIGIDQTLKELKK